MKALVRVFVMAALAGIPAPGVAQVGNDLGGFELDVVDLDETPAEAVRRMAARRLTDARNARQQALLSKGAAPESRNAQRDLLEQARESGSVRDAAGQPEAAEAPEAERDFAASGDTGGNDLESGGDDGGDHAGPDDPNWGETEGGGPDDPNWGEQDKDKDKDRDKGDG